MQPYLDLIGGVTALTAGSFTGIRAYMVRSGLARPQFSAAFWIVLSVFFLNQAMYLLLEYQGVYSFGYGVFTIALNLVSSVFILYQFFKRR